MRHTTRGTTQAHEPLMLACHIQGTPQPASRACLGTFGENARKSRQIGGATTTRHGQGNRTTMTSSTAAQGRAAGARLGAGFVRSVPESRWWATTLSPCYSGAHRDGFHIPRPPHGRAADRRPTPPHRFVARSAAVGEPPRAAPIGQASQIEDGETRQWVSACAGSASRPSRAQRRARARTEDRKPGNAAPESGEEYRAAKLKRLRGAMARSALLTQGPPPPR